MSNADITAVGLLLDIVGAGILWYFVVEVRLLDQKEYFKGQARLVLSDPTPQQVRTYKRRIALSRLGITLLVVGFILQLIGTGVFH